jgi:polyhydroxyalkanoate synthesis repressor PhaR
MRLIKRYRNRRLYDTLTSRTITQFELARMVEQGQDVRVVDSGSGEDITLTVLSRVMVTESFGWNNVQRATKHIRNAIREGGDQSMSILKNTILASIGLINVTRAKAEKIIDDLIKKGELDKSERKAAVMELLVKAEKSTEEFRKKVLKEAEKAGQSVSKFARENVWVRQTDMKKLDAKVNRLARKVKELDGRLNEFGSAKQ